MWLNTLLDSLKSDRSRTTVHQARHRVRRRQPAARRSEFEALEGRCMLSTVCLRVSDTTLVEGNAGVKNAVAIVRLSAPSRELVMVDYNTRGETAIAGSDYRAVSGKLTFIPGQTRKSVRIPVIGDQLAEFDEAFFLKLHDAENARIADRWGVVTIMDNEPRISINDVSVTEGNCGTTPLTFTVSLSAPYDRPVTVNYATADGTASAGNDYTAASGSLVFAAGRDEQNDHGCGQRQSTAGSDKTFLVSLNTPNSYAGITKDVGVGTIINDEPRISIFDAYNYGETSFTFTVSLSAAYDQDVIVSFTTADGTATAGVDYVATSGTLTFSPGETSKSITVEVLDTTSADKSLSVHLSGVSANALIANEQAYGYWYYDYGYYDYGYYDYGYYGYYDPGSYGY